jgi:Flp pilus assembly protein TadG
MVMTWFMKRLRAAMGRDRLLRDERGSTIVEWAFVGPIAILLTLGAVEMGRALFAQAAITQAVKETVRFASVRGAASGAEATVDELEAMARQLADLADAETQVAVAWAPDNRPGSVVTVTMQHDFQPVTTPFDGSTFTFDATASMTIVR